MQWTQERMSVLALSTTHGMQHFFGRIFPPLIPLLATDLTLSLWKLGLVVTLWSLANGVSQAPLGHLADRFDRRFILPTGVAVVGLGYLIVAGATAFGDSFPALEIFGVQWTGTLFAVTLGMVVAGLGRGATHPSGYPLLSANVSGRNKGKALGRWGSAAKLGDAAGPAFVGLAILLLPWEGVFAAISIFALTYSVLLFVYMTRSALETVPGNGNGEGQEETVTGYWKPIFLVLLSVIAASFAVRGIGTYLPTFVAEVYQFSFSFLGVTFGSESVASMYFSVLLLAGAGAIIAVGNLADRHDPKTLMILLYLGAVAALAALVFLPLNPFTLLLVSVLIGATLFANTPARDAIISRVVPAEREGRVFGYFWTALLLTSSAFPVLIGYMSDVVGIREGFAYLAVGPIIAILPLLLLYRWNED